MSLSDIQYAIPGWNIIYALRQREEMCGRDAAGRADLELARLEGSLAMELVDSYVGQREAAHAEGDPTRAREFDLGIAELANSYIQGLGKATPLEIASAPPQPALTAEDASDPSGKLGALRQECQTLTRDLGRLLTESQAGKTLRARQETLATVSEAAKLEARGGHLLTAAAITGAATLVGCLAGAAAVAPVLVGAAAVLSGTSLVFGLWARRSADRLSAQRPHRQARFLEAAGQEVSRIGEFGQLKARLERLQQDHGERSEHLREATSLVAALQGARGHIRVEEGLVEVGAIRLPRRPG